MAPDNLSRLAESGFEFALTTDGLKRKRDFKKNISKAVQRGLSKTDALASLTTIPAKAFGESKRLGRIAPGYIANLVVTDESYFNRKSIINSVWIEGDQFVINPEPIVEAQGKWTVKEREKSWELEISEQNLIYTASAKKDGESFSIYNLSIDQDRISFVIKDSLMANMGAVRFLGNIEKSSMNGVVVYPDNNRSQWSANLNTRMKKDIVNSSSDNASNLEVFYPEGAYGIDDGIPNPKTVLIDDATIWTSGPKGILKGYDILFQNGKIKDIAKNIYLTDQNAVIIDGKGKHVTPGLIDAHSHMAGESINEGFQNVTAEVRMRDVIDPNDIAMYRALAGGLTTINLLHGSANPIGGQNVVMKLRWGSFSNDLIFKEAPQGIKFALGENVKRKRSYGRYPETRMGVEQVIRDAFVAARDYEKLWNTYNKDAKLQRTKIPPRRDLELDAMVEIMKGDRLVHSHSYRQDEILMLTRIAEDFGFTIGTFQHVLEGYKVAERLKEHGAGASTFSDWWAYKYEVIDAIPFNGTLMADVGVNVSFNSDSDELARRMNLEAAKAVKYGGISEEKALEFVTINPAIQLGIENKVGSLEIGKDADFAIWSGHPLSNYSICEQTWIEGKQYFSLEQDKFFRARDKKLRNDIIQKILISNETGTHTMKPDSEEANHFHSCKTEGSHSHEHGGAH
ncbi:MAG: amidohydrolase family protein [Candidatus Neomarinimicrobiota bacterium]|nr:amidohydrolase family protein [Candidatus Neomarinimicrobiota bacterium]